MLKGNKVLSVMALLVLVASLAAGVVLAPAALGDEDGIRVVSHEVTGDFPDSITFKLTATGPDPISDVRVFLKPLGSEQSSYGYLDVEPGTLVSGEYVMNLGLGATHKPPGTVVRYSFEIEDEAGRVLRTEDQEFLYLDTRIESGWQQISDDEGLLTVFYYGDFVERRARTILETAQNTTEQMGPVLGITPQAPIKIVAYSNYRDMAGALPFRSQTVREELITEGQAYPGERVLLVLASETTVTGVASHEFVHILVAEAAGRGYTMVPAWLNEGLAEYGNIDQTSTYDLALNYAIFTRRLKPLWYMDTFGGDPDDILIGYGQGRSVVRYMIQTYGEAKMAELMAAFHTSLSVDEALQRVYGFDQYGLDTEWRNALGLPSLPSPEEIEAQQAQAAGQEDAGEADLTPSPTPLSEATPVPVAEATPGEPSASDEENRRTSGGCNAPSRDGASASLDVAVLALLAGPFLALNARWGIRRTGLLGGVRWWRVRLRRRE